MNRARKSAGKMSTSVTALLNETYDYTAEAEDMTEDDEPFAEESFHGK